MAATKGNQFWKIRSRHGREKLFASPELMMNAAQKYFDWCDNNPFIELKPMSVSFGGNGGTTIKMIEIPIKRPYTLQGICSYLGCTSNYFRAFKSTCSEENKDFMTTITQIEDTIYNQKFSGAASGFFNANIIARDLGLRDGTDVTTNNKEITSSIPALQAATIEQLEQFLKRNSTTPSKD